MILDPTGKTLLAVSDAGTWLRATLDYDGHQIKGLSNATIGPALPQTSSTKRVTPGSMAQGSQESYGLFSTRSEGLMVKRAAIYFLLPVALACGALFPTQGNTKESNGIAALKSRFEYLSQHSNVECSVQFEK